MVEKKAISVERHGDKVKINDKTFILHKIPAMQAREIVVRYPQTRQEQLERFQDYAEILRKLFSYADVDLGDGRTAPLDNDEIINQHIDSVATSVALEQAIIGYNFDFLANGGPSTISTK